MHVQGEGIIRRGIGVPPIKPPWSRGFSIEKDIEYSGAWFGISHKKALYHQDVLTKRLVELKYESYQEVYYIDKAVTRITIK